MRGTLKRIIKGGIVNFFRNGLVSIATVLVMSLSLLMLTSVLLGSVFFGAFITELQDKVDISVYFKQTAAEEDIQSVQSALRGLTEVKEAIYVSQDEALARFQERHKDQELILRSLDVVGENPFSASLEIRATDPSKYNAIASFLERDRYRELIDIDSQGVQKITYRQNQGVIDRLTQMLGTARNIGLGLGITLAVIAVVVAYNTVRLAIYNARDELSVMQLVGASRGFIRGPFLVEGILHGLIAAFFTIGILYMALWWIGIKTTAAFVGLNVFAYFVSHTVEIILSVSILGIVLGVLSSQLAMRRYLKV